MSVPAASFTLDGALGPIRGDVRAPARARSSPAVLLLHGFKGFKDFAFFPYLAEGLAEAGLAAVSFNFSGDGIGNDPDRFTELDKFAKNSISAMLEDLDRVLTAVASGRIAPGADRDRLGLFGHSLGGGIAILTAARESRVKAVAAWGAVSHFDRWSEEETRLWRERGYHEVVNQRTGQVFRMGRGWLADLEEQRARFDLLGAAALLRAPLLLVHGAEDETVSPEEARAISEAASRSSAGRSGEVSLRLVEGTGHTFGAVHPFPGTNPSLEDACTPTIRFLAEALASGERQEGV